MKKLNPFIGDELEMARALAKEWAARYNRRPNVEPPDVPDEVREDLHHKFGRVSDRALEEYRARFACYYGKTTPENAAHAHDLAHRTARKMQAPDLLRDRDDICGSDRQSLAALDDGHLSTPVVEFYIDAFNATAIRNRKAHDLGATHAIWPQPLNPQAAGAALADALGHCTDDDERAYWDGVGAVLVTCQQAERERHCQCGHRCPICDIEESKP